MLVKNNLGKVLDLAAAYLSLENCRACKKSVYNRHAVKLPQSICTQCWLKLLNESAAVQTTLTLKAGIVLVQAAGVHSGLLRKLIIKLKQNEDSLLARDLSYLVAKNIQIDLQLRRLAIIPMPLHKKRLHSRGFNQSELLAKALSSLLSVPLSTRALERTRDTRSQRGLHRDQRWINMQGAFIARDNLVKGKSILLIDDVHTSGATMQAAAEALFEGGAARIAGMSVAAAPLRVPARLYAG